MQDATAPGATAQTATAQGAGTRSDDAGSAFDYVIVGAGITAASAARAIRRNDENGTIAILGREPDGPYYRPDLSKSL